MNFLQNVLILLSLATSSSAIVPTITPTVTSQNMEILAYKPLITEEIVPIEDSMLISQEIAYKAPQSLTELIKSTFHSTPIMFDIAVAESGLNPKAYNPEWHYDQYGNKVCQGSFGIFQISCSNYAGNPKDLFDPVINIKLAIKVLKEQSVRAWGVCHGLVDCGKI